jgi:transcriptional regulator with XRE-family HTH domain
MLIETGYIRIMNKGKLADYFERNLLQWQIVHGRMTQAKFASLLHISPGYLNHLLEGDNTSLTFHTAIFIARLLGDYEILDILGFERPVDPEMAFPPKVEAALLSAAEIIKERGFSWNSPEAVGIITDALSNVGSKEIFRTDESGN